MKKKAQITYEELRSMFASYHSGLDLLDESSMRAKLRLATLRSSKWAPRTAAFWIGIGEHMRNCPSGDWFVMQYKIAQELIP